MTKYTFIVLETKLLNNVIHVYGGLVQAEGPDIGTVMATFQWFKLSEIKNYVV